MAQLHQPAVSLFVAFQSQGRVQTAGAQGRTQDCLEDRREKIGMVMAAREETLESEYDHPSILIESVSMIKT